MKRCVFIIEDKLTDIFGCLLTLQASLSAGCKDKAIDLGDMYLGFLHICEAGSSEEERFNTAFKDSLDYMKKYSQQSIGSARYIAVPISKDIYSTGGANEAVEKIIQEQKTYLTECGFTSEFVQGFPQACSADEAYVLLLDVILFQANGLDQDLIHDCQPVLSAILHDRFPQGQCITYTNYNDFCGDKWVKSLKTDVGEMPIEREKLTRARAIFTPLKDRLYRALGI